MMAADPNSRILLTKIVDAATQVPALLLIGAAAALAKRPYNRMWEAKRGAVTIERSLVDAGWASQDSVDRYFDIQDLRMRLRDYL
jgi:hypothetical protein